MQRNAPRYLPGHSVVLAFLLVFITGASSLMYTLLRIENRKRDQGKRDYLVEGKTQEEIDQLGDKRPDFRYTL